MPSDKLFTHVRQGGEETALLLHGQFGDGRMWRDVASYLNEHGYRVVAVDLPGHGHSPRDPTATVESTIGQLCELCPAPHLAIGHSLGGMILAYGAERLGVGRAVFVDVPLRLGPRSSWSEVERRLTATKAQRTLSWLRSERPQWSDLDCQLEAEAAELFDVATSLGLVRSLRLDPPSGVAGGFVAVDGVGRAATVARFAQCPVWRDALKQALGAFGVVGSDGVVCGRV